MDLRYYTKKLGEWYKKYHRELPWRQVNDPYKIWLSEIILQQTRISQGLPYYIRFVEQYPHVQSLANAPEEHVLRLWQGLGYYSRGRNLHKCAQLIVGDHGGEFPSTFKELLNLPGIGSYTAAAIASIAYREPVAAIDGNVIRVLSRLFGLKSPVGSSLGKKRLEEMAKLMLDTKNPGQHNQAVMEFGALHCTPKNPQCPTCLFKNKCFAFLHGLQSKLPVTKKGKNPVKRHFNYFVFASKGKLFFKKRLEKDIWHGLYDFPLVEGQKPLDINNPALHTFLDPSLLEGPVPHFTKKYRHVLTHQLIFATFIIIPLERPQPLFKHGFKAYSLQEAEKLPKPILISRFLSDCRLLLFP